MRIIAVGTLRDFWMQPGRRDAEHPLRAWVHIVRAADWSSPADVKQMFRSTDVLPNDRIVFNIGGNKYRLIVAVHYRGKRFSFALSARIQNTTGSTRRRYEG